MVLLCVFVATKVANASISYQTRDVTDAENTFVNAINDLGESVGYYNPIEMGPGANVTTGVIWDSAGTYSLFDIAGSSVTEPLGINKAGQIVGGYDDGNMNRGFLRNSDGYFIPLDVPGALETIATGINDAGLVVGFYSL